MGVGLPYLRDFGQVREEKIAGDASPRSRVRLVNQKGSAVLTRYPERSEREILAFIKISDYLLASGLSAPKVFDHDVAAGLVLEEDFGAGNLYLDILNADSSLEFELYLGALEALMHLHSKDPLEGLMPLAFEDLIKGLWQFANWGLPFYGNDSDEAKLEFMELWQGILKSIEIPKDAVVLGDYHSPNIMFLGDRVGVKSVGIIDFQDAVLGPKAYDFISLAQDARYLVNKDLYDALLKRYVCGMDEQSKERFITQCQVLGTYRICRIIGLFLFKYNRCGDMRYVQYIPILQYYLSNNISAPLMEGLKGFFDGLHLSKEIFQF